MKICPSYRPTWAEVKLGDLAYNLAQVRSLVPGGTGVMATVKADAYGHGIIPVARRLASCKADYFGVASIDEGITLRKAGIRKPVLILGLILPDQAKPVVDFNLTATVCDSTLLAALDRCARRKQRRVKAHIKVDTGMARVGVLYKDAFGFISQAAQAKNVILEGVFTHFPFADSKRDYTLQQVDAFNFLISRLRSCGIAFRYAHAANSMGIIGYRESHLNMVRPGLMLYGLYPSSGLAIRLKPVLSLKTKVIYCKRVPCGQGVSYSHTFHAPRQTTIVTLPIGYGDGYPRNLSNRGCVLIGGKRFTISGNICMDQIMVDVGDTCVKTGEEVVLIGSQGKERITTEEVAALAGTIPYEIVCGLGNRIPRVYL